MDKIIMKTFTVTEIRDLLNQVYREEISFSRMVEIMNERVSEGMSERMEEMNEPQYKDGDFVINMAGNILIFREKVGDSIYDHAYLMNDLRLFILPSMASTTRIERHATEEEKQKLFDALAKEGKQWNAEKKCIEDIPTELKNGDFVAGFGCVFILHTQIDKYSAQYHALYAKTNGNLYYYRTYSQSSNIHKLRRASEEEKQELLDALAEKGKRWNAEKLCIDNIQVRKFKVGDKVRIKHGVSSKTHDSIRPYFAYSMDKLIGKELTVEYCDNSEIVICDGYSFLKEWLEPYEELKKGDLAIFWDKVKRQAIITFYERSDEDETCLRHKDIAGSGWENVIKFESKEQFERLIKGEI